VTCSSFDGYMLAELSGNNIAGGIATFPAVGYAGASSGGCNQAAANITPTSNNNGVWNACFGGMAGTSSPWTAGANDGDGDYSEYQILSGGSGIAQTPAYSSTSGNYVVMGAAVTALSQASVPSCSPQNGSVPQTVTCTNPNSGTRIMCYTVSPTVPSTNGLGTLCTVGTSMGTGTTGTVTINSAETLEVMAGVAGDIDSSVVSYTYTAATVLTPPTINSISVQ
jgi:hypothetical protein